MTVHPPALTGQITTALEKALLAPLTLALYSSRQISFAQALEAQQVARRTGLSVADVLHKRFSVSQRTLALAENEVLATRLIDPLIEPPDRRLVMAYGPALALSQGVLPWRRVGNCTVVLAHRRDAFEANLHDLQAALGPVRMALSTPDQISGTLARGYGAALVSRAETRLPAGQSSRNWHARRALAAMLSLGAAMLLALWLAPVALLAVLCGLAVALLAITTALKIAAAIAGPAATPPTRLAQPHDLPIITLLVPLYKEREIADHLLTRLEALDYPRELLDVCLVLEAGDDTTRAALGRTRLLTWMRPINVPEGSLRTKPRALNYALGFAQGSIVGVYDAEDSPAPDQLRIVAATFAAADPTVACLQGVLDYYNSAANWLTRCFTIEYASWFRVVLPGYARLGLVVPLGGTTLFFRRNILEELNGWDAHNVTEDADLGVRLARAGYTTAFIPSVTEEEANGRFWPWVKQRSRWLKGYAITYAVHMRNPAQLWRDVGAWRFFGLQVLFAGTLSQFLLAPLIWSFWLIPLGLPHPVAALLTPAAFWTMAGLFVTCEVVNFFIAVLALRRAGKGWLIKWAPTLQFYFPLGSMAVYKGLLELTWKPFYWDKTMHGLLVPKARLNPPPPLSSHPVSAGSRTPD